MGDKKKERKKRLTPGEEGGSRGSADEQLLLVGKWLEGTIVP